MERTNSNIQLDNKIKSLQEKLWKLQQQKSLIEKEEKEKQENQEKINHYNTYIKPLEDINGTYWHYHGEGGGCPWDYYIYIKNVTNLEKIKKHLSYPHCDFYSCLINIDGIELYLRPNDIRDNLNIKTNTVKINTNSSHYLPSFLTVPPYQTETRTQITKEEFEKVYLETLEKSKEFLNTEDK